MNRNILRQITDIQVQADRILTSKGSFEQIEEFSIYNEEIKKFLVDNVKDEFILQFIHEIPIVNYEELDSKNSILAIIFNFISFGTGSIFQRNKKMDQALESVAEIRGKYASMEFMLKDYFNS